MKGLDVLRADWRDNLGRTDSHAERQLVEACRDFEDAEQTWRVEAAWLRSDPRAAPRDQAATAKLLVCAARVDYWRHAVADSEKR